MPSTLHVAVTISHPTKGVVFVNISLDFNGNHARVSEQQAAPGRIRRALYAKSCMVNMVFFFMHLL